MREHSVSKLCATWQVGQTARITKQNAFSLATFQKICESFQTGTPDYSQDQVRDILSTLFAIQIQTSASCPSSVQDIS